MGRTSGTPNKNKKPKNTAQEQHKTAPSLKKNGFLNREVSVK